ELSLSDEIAFRAQFEVLPQNPQQLYWRGPVMWEFDGRTWRSGQPTLTTSIRYQPLAPPLRYTVTLEPHEERWLFLIDLPARLPQNSLLTRDFQVLSLRPVRERLRYAAESVPVFRTVEGALQTELNLGRSLPAESAPRARELARSWRSQSANDRQIVERALQMFREQPFIYTLAPPPLGREPVDEFLFVTRRGFCEHYASSFAVLMRAAGIPTRVVTGYLGGEVNSVDGYLVVRQSEAHAWDEVWLPDEGWLRVDPTAAVSPLRIQQGLATAVPATDPQPLLRLARVEWLRQARHTWDAVTNTWNQWVLGYSPERQTRFLTSFGLSKVSWQDMVIALMLATGALIFAFAVTMFLRLRMRSVDPVQRAWLRYCRAMATRGIARRNAEGPRDFTSRLATRFSDRREQIERIGALYVEIRYGGRIDPQRLASFRRTIAAICG
ncbi:MAG: transglutaminase TgpA family protein, partial [Burkholderiales bacterium]